MKNKEWLKEEINKVTSRVYGADFNTIKETDDLIDQLEEPEQEKVLVPQFVADFIEEIKPNFNIRAVFTLQNNKHEQGQKWALDNPDVFARAWLDGYSVEKEKLYQIKLPITTWNRDASALEERTMFLAFNTTSDETTIVNSSRKNGDYRTDLTEVQIKAIDERFWTFAEEVTE